MQALKVQKEVPDFRDHGANLAGPEPPEKPDQWAHPERMAPLVRRVRVVILERQVFPVFRDLEDHRVCRAVLEFLGLKAHLVNQAKPAIKVNLDPKERLEQLDHADFQDRRVLLERGVKVVLKDLLELLDLKEKGVFQALVAFLALTDFQARRASRVR